MRHVGMLLGFLAMLAGSASVSAAAPEQACTAAKERAAGKYLARALGCHARAKSAGRPVDVRCLTRAQGRFVQGIGGAGTSCPGSAAGLEPVVQACVAILLGNVPGDGVCPSASTKALGQGANGLLRCAAQEVLAAGARPSCSAGRDARLAAALARAGGCAAPSSVADLHAACVTAVVDALVPTSTTTTTIDVGDTTTTTSTTPDVVRCCRRSASCGPFDTCELVSPEACRSGGGVDLGPGTCDDAPCVSVSTTTPPAACCLPTSPGQPDMCEIRHLCECFRDGGRFFPFVPCMPGLCSPTTTLP